MPNVPLTFFFVAAVILVGFLASRIFQVTRFPDIPLLLSLGLLVGPLNREALDYGFGSRILSENLDVNVLKSFAPFVSTLALIVILFDSGLKLDFSQFGRSMRPALAHTLPLFLLTAFLITFLVHHILGMPWIVSLCLGVGLSNVGQTVSAAIIREIDLSPEVRSIYFIEMALYDLVSIPLLVSILEFAQEGKAVPGLFFQSLARVISISVLLGVAGGLVWIYVLTRLQNYPYSYMVTLAGLLLVYSLNSFLSGSGPVSVLIFGLVIGNRHAIQRALKLQKFPVLEGERVHRFHDEITFFVRAFFFVFLGLTFNTGRSGEWTVATNLPALRSLNRTAALFLIGIALVFFAIVVARYLVVMYLSARNAPARRGLFAIYGRGLGTAVLCTFPFTLAVYVPGSAYYDLFRPWEAVFVNTALLIILLTVMGTGLTVWLSEYRAAHERAAPGPRRRPAKE